VLLEGCHNGCGELGDYHCTWNADQGTSHCDEGSACHKGGYEGMRRVRITIHEVLSHRIPACGNDSVRLYNEEVDQRVGVLRILWVAVVSRQHSLPFPEL